jgi:hypothetical protein
VKTTIACASALLAAVSAAYAQTPTPAPKAVVKPAPTPVPLVTIELTGLKPDATLWAWSAGNSVSELSVSSARISLPKSAKELYLLNKKNNQLTTISLSGVKNGKLDASKAVFASAKPGVIVINTLSSAGKPVPSASITLTTEHDGSKSVQNGVTDAGGVARFENVLPGKVQVEAKAGKVLSSVNFVALPPTPGGEVVQRISLSGGDADLAATPAPAGGAMVTSPGSPPVIVVDRAEKPETNNALPGWIGIIGLGVGGFFGWRWLKSRGMSVKDVLDKAGVNLPDEAASGVNPNLRPPSPASAPLPPLPSLGDLPSAGLASSAGVFAPNPSNGGPNQMASLPAPTGQPRLFGTRGPLAGQSFALTAPLTLGREPDNTVALPGDNTASRKHAVVMPSASGGWEIADSGSSNGTFVNGQRIQAPTPLAHGDEIAVGTARLRFEA